MPLLHKAVKRWPKLYGYMHASTSIIIFPAFVYWTTSSKSSSYSQVTTKFSASARGEGIGQHQLLTRAATAPGLGIGNTTRLHYIRAHRINKDRSRQELRSVVRNLMTP